MNPLLPLLVASLIALSNLTAQTNDLSSPPSVDELPPVAVPATPLTTAPSAEIPSKGPRPPAAALDQKGKIEKISAEERTFTVAGKDFVFSKRGKAFIDGALVSLSNLKVGDLVAVTYFARSNGTNFATRIIKGYKHSKKTKKPDEKSP